MLMRKITTILIVSHQAEKGIFVNSNEGAPVRKMNILIGRVLVKKNTKITNGFSIYLVRYSRTSAIKNKKLKNVF